MRLATVIPISRGISKEVLTYFSSKDIQPGAVVAISVRKRIISGLVISSEQISNVKSEVKNLPFQMKKIEGILASSFFPSEFIQAAEQTAEYTASTTGAVLQALTSKHVLENIEELAKLPTEESVVRSEAKEIQILQAIDEERISYYKSLIREEFARKRSVFICTPTVEHAKSIIGELQKGIENYSYLLHGGMTKKDVVKTWTEIMTTKHPLLIVGTSIFLGIPKANISTIIIEQESSRGYKSGIRPFVDVRFFAEKYAKNCGARLIFADVLLRSETLWKYEQGQYVEAQPLKWRSISSAHPLLIDMKAYQTKAQPEFRILSDELIELIKYNKEENQHLFIMAGRRGLSPNVVCGDCSEVVLCNNCSSPVVLHGSTTDKNFFLCHHCGERRSAEERCKNCESWRLTTLGIGSETVEVAVKGMVDTARVFRLDADTVTTSKQARNIITEFMDSPGSVLIGTEMALPFLPPALENIAIASIDSLFSLPDFRINERIFHMLLRLRTKATSAFVIQTRHTQQKVWDFALKGNISDFHKSELNDREMFGYPPFTTLIKITYSGPRDTVVNEMNHLKEYMNPYEIYIFPAFIETVKNKFVMHGIIKLLRNNWIDPTLLNKLRGLPPHYAVNIDPENLL